MAASASSPCCATVWATSAKTPKGAISMTRWVTFRMTSAALPKKSPISLPSRPASRMPMPSRMAKKMMASTSPSASEATGFSGTMASRRSVSEGASVETGTASALPRSTPAPGRKVMP